VYILYSSFSREHYEELDAQWMSTVPRSCRFTYVPSSGCCRAANQYFDAFISYYSHYGFRRFVCLDAAACTSKRERLEALSSEVIYLSGGNTFTFAGWLQRTGLWEELGTRGATGSRIVLGLSAGAIILTPSLVTATIGPVIDDPGERVTCSTGMRCVPFGFLPHFDESELVVERARVCAQELGRDILLCPDGAGVIVRSVEGGGCATKYVGAVLPVSGRSPSGS
jgi:dipeptidase E